MIKYKLNCKNCKKRFDSWFASSLEYDKIKKKNLLNCHYCGSPNIEKSLMAPNLKNAKKNITAQKIDDISKIRKKIKDYQEFIKKNFKYVGENFAYEARSIHYSEKKTKKGIYGMASKKDINDLKDEGIETQSIPWINEKEN